MRDSAFLGLNGFGPQMVRRLLDQKARVHLWARWSSPVAALMKGGASYSPRAEVAVRDARSVHLDLGRDEETDSVLLHVMSALPSDVLVLDHSSTTGLAKRMDERAQSLRAAKVRFLHAPMVVVPEASGSPRSILLVCGDENVFRDAESYLRTLSDEVRYVGSDRAMLSTIVRFVDGLHEVRTPRADELDVVTRCAGGRR